MSQDKKKINIKSPDKSDLIILNNYWSNMSENDIEIWKLAAEKVCKVYDENELNRCAYNIYIMRFTDQDKSNLDKYSLKVFNGCINIPEVDIINGQVKFSFNYV